MLADVVERISSTATITLSAMQTPKLRNAYNIKALRAPFITPTLYTPNDKTAVKISLKSILGRLMQHDKIFRQGVIAKSDEWKLGKLHNVKADVLRDISDGDKCRFHPHLMRLATPLEANVVRIGIHDYNDDLTTVNPIGTKRGDHKYTTCLAGVINLPQMVRYSTDYILLLAIVVSKIQKVNGGMAWVLCGVNSEGEQTIGSTYAEEMRELESGIEIDIPDDSGKCKPRRIVLQVAFCI